MMCTFCPFETLEMLKLCFKMFDRESTGYVDKDEIRHFIYGLHGTKENTTIEMGLKYLEDNDDGDGQFEFYQIKDMHFKFQVLFYPVFRLLVQMRRRTLGERWWDEKIQEMQENKEQSKLRALAEQAAKNKKGALEAEMQNEKDVQMRMGIWY